MEDVGDDFGDLYADVAIQASSAIIGAPDFVRFYEDDTNKAEDFASGSGSKELDSGDADSSRKSENEEPNMMDYGSDSEDDLNIVLNDEEGQRFPVRGAVGVVGRCDGDDGDGMEQGFAGGEKGNGAKCGYHLQFSQYKYVRSYSTGYSSNIKVDGAAKVASSSSMLARGDREESNQLKCSSLGDVASTCTIGAPLAAQGGYGFSLPWYRSILDVNIDTFEQKPWRHPGVDLTDFFNFGFNEETWKNYCNSLEQYRRQMCILNQTPMYHYSKPSQTTEGGLGHEKDIQEHACKQGNLVSLASKSTERLELPKGRAIQVEGSTGERQPSMDVRRPRQRDSDVVIHIAVQNSVDDDMDPIDGTNDESSETGDINCYGSGDGNKSCLDNNVTLESSSDLKRSSKLSTASDPVSVDSDIVGNGKLPDVGKHCSQNKNFHVPEGIYEVVDALYNKKERVGRKTCSGDPGIMETELSLDERVSHSPSSSCDGSYCGISQDNSYVDPEKNQNARRNPSSNFLIDKPESITSDYYLHQNPKKSVGKTRQIEHKDSLRNRSPVLEAQNHHVSRSCCMDELPCCSGDDVASPMSKTDSLYDRDDSSVGHGRQKGRLHDFDCHDDDVSPMSNSEGLYYNHYLSGGRRRSKERLCDSGSYDDDFYPMSETESLHDKGHSFSGRCRQKEQLLSFDLYDREGLSYYKETDFSFNYCSEKFADDHVRTAHAKKPRREDHWSFGDKRYSHFRNKYFFQKRITRVENKMMETDWHHCERNGNVMDISHLTRRESRQLVLKHSYTDKEKDARQRKKNDKLQLPRGPDNNDDLFQCKNSDDYAQEKSRRSFPFMWKERNSLAEKYGRYMPNSWRKGNFYRREKRYKDNHLDLDWDHSWCIGVEDEYEKPVDHRFLSSRSYIERHTTNGRNDLNDSRLTERHGIDRRHICPQGFRESDWFGNHNDVYNSENGIADLDDQVHIGRRRSRRQYEALLCTENKLISSHLDENLHDKEASLSFERASRHTRIHAKYGSAHAGMLIHDKKLEQQKCRRIREGRSDNFINWSSNVLGQSNHEQTVTRSRDSVDLVVGEGKSFGRSSKARTAMRHERLEDMGWKVDEEQRNLKGFNKPQRGNCLDKFVVTEDVEALDIEEGQIIPEETNRDDLVERDHAYQSKSPSRNVERRLGHANRNKVAAECDNQQRILQIRAKMEKREQRFKAPITLKKEPEIVPNPELEPVLIVEPSETMQQRRVRKRRWNGS